MHYESPKTVCKAPFASIFPPSMENGDGTRYHFAASSPTHATVLAGCVRATLQLTQALRVSAGVVFPGANRELMQSLGGVFGRLSLQAPQPMLF